MKKVILLLSVIILAGLTGCTKEEQTPIQYDFSVETPDEKFTEKRVNEEVNIPIQVKSLYDFSRVSIKYKVDWDKRGKLKIGGKEIQKGEMYPINTTSIQFSYVGLEEGKHRIELNFFNDKGTNVEKEINLSFIKDDFSNNFIEETNIYDFSVNCTISSIAQLSEEGYSDGSTNIANIKVKAKAKKENLIEKIKIEIPEFESLYRKVEKEYSISNNQLNTEYSEYVFYAITSFDPYYGGDYSYRDQNGKDTGLNQLDLDKYNKTNIERFIKTRPKAKLTLFDSSGKVLTKEVEITFNTSFYEQYNK